MLLKEALLGSLMAMIQLIWVSGLPTKLEVSITESLEASRSESLEAVQPEVQGQSRGNNVMKKFCLEDSGMGTWDCLQPLCKSY